MDHRVSATLRDQPSIHRKGSNPGDSEREGEASPEQTIAETGLHGSGNEEHDRVVDDFHDHDGKRVGCKGDREHRSESEPGPQQRHDGKRVAEEEREHDCKGDRRNVAPAEGRRDREPENLADGTPREAVGRRRSGQSIQRLRWARVIVNGSEPI